MSESVEGDAAQASPSSETATAADARQPPSKSPDAARSSTATESAPSEASTASAGPVEAIEVRPAGDKSPEQTDTSPTSGRPRATATSKSETGETESADESDGESDGESEGDADSRSAGATPDRERSAPPVPNRASETPAAAPPTTAAPTPAAPPTPAPAPVVIADRRGRGVLDLLGRLAVAASVSALAFVLARPGATEAPKPSLTESELKAIAAALETPKTPGVAAPPSPAGDGAGGRLVSFGPGRALYADGTGRFLIVGLRGDGRLEVERAVELVRDPRRLHGRTDRSPHHYYFEDVGEALAARAATLKAELDRLLAVTSKDQAQIRKVDRVTRRLAGFHAVDQLIPLLASERFFVRRAAAMALADQGYLIGFPTLIFAMDSAEPGRRRRVHEAINALSGETIIPTPGQIEIEDAAARATAWWEENQRSSPYALGVEMQRRIERRLRRGL